jgi:hypothetical protein
MNKTLWITVPFLILAAGAWAQSSANYRIEQGTFNNGGNPSPILASDSYQMTLDSIGDGIAAAALSSASYEMGTGLPPAYPPPGEVLNLRWFDKDTLAWDPYPKMTLYNLYRGNIANLTDGYGGCLQGNIAGLTADDASPPPAGGYFYLVTTESSIEEGTLGTDSSGARRPLSSPCE